MGTSSGFVEHPGPLLTPDVLDPYKLAADEYQRSFNQDWQNFLDFFKF